VEAELLAAVETVRAASWLLRKATGTKLVTDHQAVTYVGKLAEHRHGRLARWATRLLEFDLLLAYRPGKEAVVPDAISRAPIGAQRLPAELEKIKVAGTVREQMALPEQDEAAGVEQPRPKVQDVRQQLAQLDAKSADLIFVDYPWRHDADRKERFFRRMEDDEWTTLWPALDRVAADDAILVLDVPVCMLVKLGEALNAQEQQGGKWGYHTSLVWDRERPAPSRNWPGQQHELFAVCSRGNYSQLLRSRRRSRAVPERQRASRTSCTGEWPPW
jgi:hypothetical protein